MMPKQDRLPGIQHIGIPKKRPTRDLAFSARQPFNELFELLYRRSPIVLGINGILMDTEI